MRFDATSVTAAMDDVHALAHVRALRDHVAFLRPLRPENPNYKLWLGDVVELVNTIWGPGSTQGIAIIAALRRDGASDGQTWPGLGPYLERLGRLDAVLADCERTLSSGNQHLQ